MKLFIPKDMFDNPRPPRIFLCTTGGKRIGELPAYESNLTGKWNSYGELTFSIDRQYVDVLTGEAKIHPLFDKAEGLRQVLVENMGYFIIQDPDTTYGDKDSKTLSSFSSEYATGSKYLENFYINTGEETSKEVIYLSSMYGNGYSIDTPYTLASGAFDAYESYYIREYTDSDTYIYEQVEIRNATEYATYDGSTVEQTLYVKKYPNVRFYWPSKPELSLLHLIFEKIPEWSIGNVDATLWRKERKFEEERIAVYDFLMNSVSDTFKCVVEWDTLNRRVNFYEEADDGITDDGTVQSRWETDVYVSRENLANEINVKYSTDNIKTKLRVSGSDELDIREVNLGKNYIMNLDFYHNSDWMEPDLLEAYDDYLEAVKEYSGEYTDAMQGWVAAYNKWNDLMNAVPAEGNVVLVGDEFKKLYCVYAPVDTAYLSQTLTDDDINTLIVDNLYSLDNNAKPIDKTSLTDGATFLVQGYRFVYVDANDNFKCVENMLSYGLDELINPSDGKLKLYHVNEDTEANKNDNILLRLKNPNSDVATIRIYNSGTETSPVYLIQSVVVSASSGVAEAAKTYTMSQWINGELTAEKMGFEGYTVNYIGVMGAYFVLAKDEKQPSTLEEYGVNLLQEKHETYLTIFRTQTEAMLSQEGYQCIAQNDQPNEDYDKGTRWLDTDSNPVKLYEYDGAENWTVISAEVSETDQSNYENYQRYIDNYEKMVAVQQMLLQKEKEAEYWLNGYEVQGRAINYKEGDGDSAFYAAADAFFRTDEDGNDTIIISNGTLHTDYGIPIFTFTHHSAQQSYVAAGGAYNADMDYYKKIITVYDLDTYQPATETTKEDRKVNIETYTPIDIVSKEVYDTYDGSSNDKTLYVLQKDNLFAVYLVGNVPYVAYAESQGVYQATRNTISRLTELENFFSKEQWIALSPLIREDEYSDDNFLLTGYESEEERLKICQELLESADKELKTLSQPSLEFSMNMANILALPEFEPITSQFALGNFIRIELRPGIVKRARLLEVNLNFEDLSDFSANFGNLITTKSEIDLHAELLSQAVQAGKTVATAASDWQRAVDKSNKLEEAIASGLQDASLQVGRANGQAISWDDKGFFCRKFVDGSTDTYLDEQIAIINNKIVFTNDGWKTSKAALGEFELDINGDGVNEKMYGLLADAVVSGYVKGSVIEGGSLRIGGNKAGDGVFIVNEDGSVEIKVLTESDGKLVGIDKYASQSAVEIIDSAYRFRLALSYDGSTIFSDTNQTCTITCNVYDYDTLITDKVIAANGTFSWIRSSSENDETWNATHIKQGTNANKITLTSTDVVKNSNFTCSVDFDETKITI